MNIDLNSIIAIVSTLTTVAITAINTVQNIKIKKLELENSRLVKEMEAKQRLKDKVIEMYYVDKKAAFLHLTECVGKQYVATTNGETHAELQSSAQTALLFCDYDKSRAAISDMLQAASDLYFEKGPRTECRNNFFSCFEKLTDALHTELQLIKHLNDFNNVPNRIE